jgi:hypothetical protein
LSVWQNIKFLRAFDSFTASVGKDGSFMSWLSSLISLGVAALSIFAPQLQHLISAHPAVTGVVGSIVAIINHLLPSPTGAAIVPATGESGTATAVK